MRSQSLAVDLATTEGENLKSLARKTWAFWDLRVVSPGLRSCATRFWVWAMCFFHINLTRTSVNTTYFGGNSRLPGRILEWWLHRARHIRHISKKCRSCARIFECLTTNLLSFMSWWFGRVKTALNHQRFGSANWMTLSQHWSTSWNQVLGCPIPISFNVFFWEWYHPIFHKHEYYQPPRSNHFLVYPIRIPPMMPCRGCRGFVRSRYDSPTYPWLPSGNLT